MRKDLNAAQAVCEIVLPAEADQKAQSLLSEGSAAPRREQGLAAAEAMRL